MTDGKAEVNLEGDHRALEIRRTDADEHAAGGRAAVRLVCINGHEFVVRLEARSYGSCPHGTVTEIIGDRIVEKAVQVDLVCVCGARLSVVGHTGQRSCPRCARVMMCPRCVASASPQREQPQCPVCGTTSVMVQSAPPVVFSGDIVKTIPSGGS